MTTPIILASNSPRRKELLKQVGLAFLSDAANVDEHILPGEFPEMYAERVALEKAMAVKSRTKSGIIIGADTIVVLDNTILGKPVDHRDAEHMLSMLSGNMHRVITGLALVDAEKERKLTGHEVTRVWFHTLTRERILSYVRTGEPLDKAGAYGIQGKGALLVDRIDGCYFNVVGLPLSFLDKLLTNFGFRLP
jgi:septum formation protein